jgi:hypothetical protein
MQKILILLIILMLCGCEQNTNESANKIDEKIISDLKNDAISIILDTEAQYIFNDTMHCYSIKGLNPNNYFNDNAGNYVGSVYIQDIGDKNNKIWLSDGEYMVRGTKDNLEVFRSTLEANNNCNK